jgi:hypothetical protein
MNLTVRSFKTPTNSHSTGFLSSDSNLRINVLIFPSSVQPHPFPGKEFEGTPRVFLIAVVKFPIRHCLIQQGLQLREDGCVYGPPHDQKPT